MSQDRSTTPSTKIAATPSAVAALSTPHIALQHKDAPPASIAQPHAEGAKTPAFSVLLAHSRPKLWLIAAAVTNDRTEADDILQEAAIVGLAKFASFTPAADIQESFERWMGQITRNLALNARRKRNRSDASIADTYRRTIANANPGLARDSETTAALERLLPALEDLEEAERTCLVLRVVGGLSYKAISTVTGFPEGTAMSHVFRARQHLRRRVLGVESDANKEALDRTEASGMTEGDR